MSMTTLARTTYVIGIGTGRCGTKSLAELIDGCDRCVVRHEMESRYQTLPWDFDRSLAAGKLSRIRSIQGLVVGDVASYYLNYLEYYLQCLPDLRIVHVFRDKDLVVASFLRKTGERNHWMDNDPNSTRDSRWDKCFPTFNDAPSKAEAIACYCDEYFRQVARLRTLYPKSILDIHVDTLNDRSTQDRVFSFLGLPRELRQYRNVHANQLSQRKSCRRKYDLTSLACELTMPRQATLIVPDIPDLSAIRAIGYNALPFLERHGEYWGRPANGEVAVSRLRQMQIQGARFMCFFWPAFWWLEYYVELRDYLCGSATQIRHNRNVVIFELRGPGH